LLNNYIAADIGASGGRLILANVTEGKLNLREIHRFPNSFTQKNNIYVWDVDYLLEQILIGLAKAKQMGIMHCTLGIDTWAVDYVLVDKDGQKIKDAVSYRDSRTKNVIAQVSKLIPKDEHYKKTGIQFLDFNTIYQLYTEPTDIMAKTKHILLIPDYLGFCLTGKAVTEYTNATTTALLNHETKKFDKDLLKIAKVSEEQFAPFAQPGQELGDVKGFDNYDLPKCKVVVTASHDTASAVLGTPGIGDNRAFLSSGTWSLLGIETKQAIVTNKAREANYSNEGGAYGTYRFLKNIMGMWLLQEVHRNLEQKVSYEELVQLAEKATPYQYFINPNDPAFLNPPNMLKAIQAKTNRLADTGEVVRCIFDSLAVFYKLCMDELEEITGKNITELIVIGGGSRNYMLNQLVADKLNKTVTTGPVEATAMGNIACQLISTEGFSITKTKELIKNSFESKTFTP